MQIKTFQSLPVRVQRDILEDMGISEPVSGDTIYLHEIAQLTPEDALKHYLAWNGIIGYTSNILSIMNLPKEVK